MQDIRLHIGLNLTYILLDEYVSGRGYRFMENGTYSLSFPVTGPGNVTNYTFFQEGRFDEGGFVIDPEQVVPGASYNGIMGLTFFMSPADNVSRAAVESALAEVIGFRDWLEPPTALRISENPDGPAFPRSFLHGFFERDFGFALVCDDCTTYTYEHPLDASPLSRVFLTIDAHGRVLRLRVTAWPDWESPRTAMPLADAEAVLRERLAQREHAVTDVALAKRGIWPPLNLAYTWNVTLNDTTWESARVTQIALTGEVDEIALLPRENVARAVSPSPELDPPRAPTPLGGAGGVLAAVAVALAVAATMRRPPR